MSRNRKLTSVGDTLYMFDERNRIVWKWTSDGPPFTDNPIIDSTGTIYVLGYDLLWAAIDSATGHEKWRSTASGRALFSQIKLYRREMYLVVTDMEGYRDSLRDRRIENNLSLCRGNSLLWETHIPANSRVEVTGNRVLVVFTQNKRAVRRRIIIPHRFGKPIGRVSGLVDYE
ncbi:MAG TPA: hypothetical protein VHE60_07680 [Pyrinomonadaceae bacterium]|nr:hypothetical protein [Pyrinomonadaceae bacterium]